MEGIILENQQQYQSVQNPPGQNLNQDQMYQPPNQENPLNYDSSFQKQQEGIQFNSMSGNLDEQQQMNGFQPAQQNWGFQQNNEDDDLDEEERERIAQIELEQEERKRKMYEKTVEEEQQKRERKIKAREELDRFLQDRKKQIELMCKLNIENEQNYKEQKIQKKEGPNPWERVVENCEMNSSNYVGMADVSRMRQAILSRKGDIQKQGGMK